MQTLHERQVHLQTEQPIWDLPVAQRIQHLRGLSQTGELPKNWDSLPNTGFWIEPQMQQLPEDWTSEDMNHWLDKAKADVHGYTLEYLAKKGVFPILYDMQQQADGAYLTAPLYDNRKLLDVINPEERHGALVDALAQVTSFFADAKTPDGSLAVITSVKGRSNLFDPDTGKEIVFPDSQRYLLQKRGDTVVGFTVRTDATLTEERAFIERLTGVTLAEDAPVEDYVRAVAMITPDQPQKPKSFADTVHIMESIHGRELAFSDPKEGIAISWDEIYEDIARTDLWDFPSETGQYFQEFADFADALQELTNNPSLRPFARKLLQEGLAATVLEISRYIGADRQKKTRREDPIDLPGFAILAAGQGQPKLVLPSYGSTMQKLQASGGCSKSGEESGLGTDYKSPEQQFIDSLTPRVGVLDSEKQEWFTCPECDYHATGPIGNQCPGCGLKKGDYKGPKCD